MLCTPLLLFWFSRERGVHCYKLNRVLFWPQTKAWQFSTSQKWRRAMFNGQYRVFKLTKLLKTKRCHVIKTHWSLTKEQAVLKLKRKQSTPCIKVQFSSSESKIEGLPFFCGWGWDSVWLYLEKEFEGAARQ